MAQRLLNKVAVVTGAGGIWGRAIVQAFLLEGAKVVAFEGNRGRLEELAAANAARVLVVEGDATNDADLEKLVETTVRRFGSVDVLVPVAEVFQQASLAVCSRELVSVFFAHNVDGVLQTVRVFEQHLNRDASVIFLTTPPEAVALETVAPGTVAPGTVPSAGQGPYRACKAALASLAVVLACELSPRGIRVNCVAPAPIRASPGQGTTGASAADVARRRAECAAGTVLFLACDDSAGVTGHELTVGRPDGLARP